MIAITRCISYANHSKEFQKTRQKRNKAWLKRHFSHLIFPMLPLIIAAIFAFAVSLMMILTDNSLILTVIGIYIVVQAWIIYYAVFNLRNHKKYEKTILDEGGLCVRRKALRISQILIEAGYLISFCVILLLALKS